MNSYNHLEKAIQNKTRVRRQSKRRAPATTGTFSRQVSRGRRQSARAAKVKVKINLKP